FIIGGNSMGGKHALAFAITHPDRVSGLVLVDASGGPMPQDKAAKKNNGGGNIGFRIARMPGVNRLAEQITPRNLIAQSLEQSVSVKSIITEQMIDRYWELLRYPGNRRATLKRFGYPYESLTEAEIAGVTAPTLILWGEQDRLIPVAAGQWLAKVMPTAQITVYPNIGHLPQEEAPAATLGDLLPWLAEHAPVPNA
ncbi:MAG: alpha/beta hydrolase, partial [Erythrobacter sp.]|nr:alpha/beta hydrolase [Erythrobacter sp.]